MVEACSIPRSDTYDSASGLQPSGSHVPIFVPSLPGGCPSRVEHREGMRCVQGYADLIDYLSINRPSGGNGKRGGHELNATAGHPPARSSSGQRREGGSEN